MSERIFSDHRIVNTLTSSSQNGDFSRAVAAQAGIIPSVTGDPIILIVKKNVTILEKSYRLAEQSSRNNGTGRKKSYPRNSITFD